MAVAADVIVLVADDDMIVALDAVVFGPDHRRQAAVILHHSPRASQRAVGRRYFVMQNVRIGLVEENPLPDNGLVVVRHRRARLVEKARSLQVTGLDLEGVEAAIAVGVEPFSKRIAGIGQWRVIWPGAAIGIDTTGLLGYQFKKDECPVWREDNLEGLDAGHLPWHAAGDAPVADVVALAAVGLVLEAGLMDCGIFGLERRLLSAARRLAGVVPGRTAIRHASPLARPVRVFAEVDDLRRRARRPQGGGDCDGADRSRVLHQVLPSPARTKSCAAFVSLRNYHTASLAALEAPANRRKAVAAPDSSGSFASVVRAALNEMKSQGADLVEIAIPGLTELLTDRFGGNLIIRQDFKFDFNSYLAARPTAPVHSLEEVLASAKFHPAVKDNLNNSQSTDSRDTKEYIEHRLKRDVLRETILKAMADNRVDALVYPTIRRKANLIGQAQLGTNCRSASNSGLPAIVVPGGITPDGLPVGVELLGRSWSEPQLIKLAYAYEQATNHRRPPPTTPALAGP